MGRHSNDPVERTVSNHDLVIRHLAKLVDAYRCEQTVGWIRDEEEVERDIQEIIDDAWREIEDRE
jgi:hypothetical protein